MGRKPANQTKSGNYLLRSRTSSILLVAKAIELGRVKFREISSTAGVEAIIVKDDGSWAGTCDWAYVQLANRGIATCDLDATRAVLRTAGRTLLHAAMNARGERNADAIGSLEWTAAKIDGIDVNGGVSAEPIWCNRHGWHAGNATCVECLASTAPYRDINDAPTIEPAPAAEQSDVATKFEAMTRSDASDIAPTTEYLGYPFGVPSDPGYVRPNSHDDIAQEIARRAIETRGDGRVPTETTTTEPPRTDPLDEYRHIIDARAALAPANVTGLVRSYDDEAAYWRRLAGLETRPHVALAFRLAARAAELAIPQPEYPAPGSAIPGQPGYLVGECGHQVASSEWRAGFRTCERCLSRPRKSRR